MYPNTQERRQHRHQHKHAEIFTRIPGHARKRKNSRAETRIMLHLCRKAYRNSKIWAENSNAVLFKQTHWGSKTSKMYYINSLRSQASTHCLSNQDTKFSKILPLGDGEFSSDSLRCVLLLLSDRVDECSEQELHSPRGLWLAPLPPSAPLAPLLRALLVPACGWGGIRDSRVGGRPYAWMLLDCRSYSFLSFFTGSIKGWISIGRPLQIYIPYVCLFGEGHLWQFIYWRFCKTVNSMFHTKLL